MDKWTSDIIAWVRRRNDRKMSTFWTLADGAGNLKTPAGWWWWSFKSYFLVLQIKFSISRKSFLELSIGLRLRDISRVSGHLSGIGDGFPNTSHVLMEHGYILGWSQSFFCVRCLRFNRMTKPKILSIWSGISLSPSAVIIFQQFFLQTNSVIVYCDCG